MEELDGDSDSAALRLHLWLNRTERRRDANLSSGERETVRLKKKKKEKGSCHPVSRQVEIRLLVFFVFSLFKELAQEEEEGEREEGNLKKKKQKGKKKNSLSSPSQVCTSFLFHFYSIYLYFLVKCWVICSEWSHFLHTVPLVVSLNEPEEEILHVISWFGLMG